jgi:hypothetical protein
MNVNQHPLNQAAQQRAKKDRLDLPPGVPVFQLAAAVLDLPEDHPDALRLANAQRVNLVSNSLLLLQDNELTPDDLLTQPLPKLAETIVDALTPAPPADPA